MLLAVGKGISVSTTSDCPAFMPWGTVYVELDTIRAEKRKRNATTILSILKAE